jgi:hypothetical protein
VLQQREMTRDARVANLPLVVGSILTVSGAVCNPWLVGALLSPDGQIGRSSDRAILWGLSIAVVLSGIAMVRFRRRPSVWKAASLARLPLLIAWTLLVLEISVRAINSVYALERPPHLANTYSNEWLEGGDWFNGLTRLYRYTPNSSGSTYGHPFRANRWGFRGPDFQPRERKPDGSFRVMVIGDSTTMGEAVAEERRYSDLLSGELKRAYPGLSIEVINLGVSGLETLQEAKIMRRFWSVVEPDFVILGFSINDPNLHYDYFDTYKVPMPAAPHNLLGRFESFRLFEQMYDITYRKVLRKPTALEEMWEGYAPQSRDWQLFEHSVADIGMFAREKLNRAPMAICLHEVNVLKEHGVHRQVVDAFETNGFTWVEIPPGVFQPVSRFEAHANEATHEQFARALFEKIQRERVIETWQQQSQR